MFLALDLLLFFFFWEMMLVPMYFLIALWGYDVPGGKTRSYAAIKFFIFTQASGLLMLVAILGLVYVALRRRPACSRFDYHDLLGTPMTRVARMAADARLLHRIRGEDADRPAALAGCPMRTPTRRPRFGRPRRNSAEDRCVRHCCASAFRSFRTPSAEFAPIAMWLGVVGVVYGAVVAFSQTDIKRLVAYTSISHMGFVVIGIYRGHQQALNGVGGADDRARPVGRRALHPVRRTLRAHSHTRDLRQMGGLWSRLPNLPPLLLFFAIATLGLPGLGNFVGEFLILSGTFVVAPWVAIAASTGLVFAVVYSLDHGAARTAGPGRRRRCRSGAEPRRSVDARTAMMVALIVLLIGLGLYPQPVIDAAVAPMQAFETIYSAAQPGLRSEAPRERIVTALMPLLITAATVVLAMLTIALRRAHRSHRRRHVHRHRAGASSVSCQA